MNLEEKNDETSCAMFRDNIKCVFRNIAKRRHMANFAFRKLCTAIWSLKSNFVPVPGLRTRKFQNVSNLSTFRRRSQNHKCAAMPSLWTPEKKIKKIPKSTAILALMRKRREQARNKNPKRKPLSRDQPKKIEMTRINYSSSKSSGGPRPIKSHLKNNQTKKLAHFFHQKNPTNF